MAVIDEKLTRMKELAEQAATGTYTTVQREIINSEYQAMAAEIDRIAAATEFNGVKLLDGSISAIHQGKGLKIHFGTGNNEAEDYYFVKIGDIRATSQSGLRIGGDAKNDIWGTVGTHGGPNTTGCCGGGIPSLNEPVEGWNSGEVFAYGYNWDLKENDDEDLKQGRYVAGAYQVDGTPTLQELLDMVNKGTQARVRIDFETGTTVDDLSGAFPATSSLTSAQANEINIAKGLYLSGYSYTGTFKLDNTMINAMKDDIDPTVTSAHMTAGNTYPVKGSISSADLKTLANLGVDISGLTAAAFSANITVDNKIITALSAMGFNVATAPLVSGNTFTGTVTVNEELISAIGLTKSEWVSGKNFVDPIIQEGAHRVCIGNEMYYIGSATLGKSANQPDKEAYSMMSARVNDSAVTGTTWAISALAAAINGNPDSDYWAKLETFEYRSGYTSLYVFAKEGGDKKDVSACDEQLGAIRGSATQSSIVKWHNDELGVDTEEGTYFNNGGLNWGTLNGVPTGYGSWGVQLEGRDVGDQRDLQILNVGSGAAFDIRTDYTGMPGRGFGLDSQGNPIDNILGLDRQSFVEIQNAADGDWAGAHVRSQSHAQEALDAIQSAIERKDKVRAELGAYQNRLENTITNLEIQAENLQASESRISDMDMATEMTTFVKNQVLTQAAISMLSQANSLPQMALSLLNG
jgi:flagellin-like hook-associated protein FlgL